MIRLVILLLLPGVFLFSSRAIHAEEKSLESLFPEASEIGKAWTRDQDLLIDDLDDPPEIAGSGEDATLARDTLALVIPMLKGARVSGAANFSYYPEDKMLETIDIWLRKFQTVDDCRKFWNTYITGSTNGAGGAIEAPGEENLLVGDGGTAQVLHFRTGKYNVKIVTLTKQPKLVPLAKMLDENIRKAASD